MSCVDPAQRERRAGRGTRLLVGAGVRVGARCRRRLVARRVRRDRDRLVRRVQVRHRRQRPRALPIARHLDPRNRTQQTETRTTGHHLRTRARRECPRARTLPPVRGARLSAHSDFYVTQKSHPTHKYHEHGSGAAPAAVGGMVRAPAARPVTRKTTLLNNKHRDVV